MLKYDKDLQRQVSIVASFLTFRMCYIFLGEGIFFRELFFFLNGEFFFFGLWWLFIAFGGFW